MHKNVQNVVYVQVDDDGHIDVPVPFDRANGDVPNVLARVDVTGVLARLEVPAITAESDGPHVPAQLNIPVLSVEFDEGECTVLYTNVDSLLNKIN